MLRTIEIQDDLQDRIDSCLSDIKNYFLETVFQEYGVDDTTDLDELDTYDLIDQANYDGSLDSFVDSAVPIYTTSLKGLWYLYESDFVAAYESIHGSSGNPLENEGMSAVFCYIEQEVRAQLEDLVSVWVEQYQGSLKST